MTLRRELLLTLGILVGINVLVSFGAIGLFIRMRPAIDKILRENVNSIEAAQTMFSVLVRSKPRVSMSLQNQEIFRNALDMAQANVTESSEQPIIARIRENFSSLVEGNTWVLDVLSDDLNKLIAINRTAMEKANDNARRLGEAGGWAAVIIAMISFVLGMVILRQTDQKILQPLKEIHDVLQCAQSGDVFRRCKTIESAGELEQMMANVNSLLDKK